MRKTTILVMALALVLAASTFASARNYIGAGIGIVGQATDEIAGPYIGTLALDFEVMDKLTFSANGYLEVSKAEVAQATPSPLAGFEFNYMVGAYAKYAVLDLNGLSLGPVVGVNYNSNFAPKVEVLPTTATPEGLKYGAGVFASQALGETGTIYGQAMYWLPTVPDAPITDAIGGLGGINFRLTDKIAVKGQIEYVNKHTLFSIGAGYVF